MTGATSQTPEEKPCVTIVCIGALWGITDFQAPAPAPPKSSSFLSQRLLLSLPNGTLESMSLFVDFLQTPCKEAVIHSTFPVGLR